MKPERIQYFTDRSEWRAWLKEHFSTESEVWLIYPKKVSGKKRIPYNDAVEEALCFGWIDSTVKSLDADHSMQRFTPRRPRSSYSQSNVERLRWLLAEGLVHPSQESKAREIVDQVFIFPKDILAKLQEDKEVWEHFQQFTSAYQRIRIAYIESARKRPEEFQKRLANFLNKTRKNKIIGGYGGIEKYY